MKRLFLIDGSALAYRAHFAFAKNPLRNSRGEDTSAAFGVTSAILRLMKEHHPDLIGVSFDTPKPTFRHERFEAYKAKRRPMPKEMVLEMPLIKEILGLLGRLVAPSQEPTLPQKRDPPAPEGALVDPGHATAKCKIAIDRCHTDRAHTLSNDSASTSERAGAADIECSTDSN